MDLLLAMRGARKLVSDCANIRKGEEVVIVTDFAGHRVAETIAAAALERTDNVNIVVMPPRSIDGQEPTKAVAAAMASADVIFTPVQQSITHTYATRTAIGNGARGIMLSQFNLGMLVKGGIEADFESIRPLCFKVGELLAGADRVRLTTPAGTDLRLSVKGRPANPHCGIVRAPGDFTTVPNIECSSSPVEGTSHGVIVVDASIPYYGIGLVKQPIRMEVADGRSRGSKAAIRPISSNGCSAARATPPSTTSPRSPSASIRIAPWKGSCFMMRASTEPPISALEPVYCLAARSKHSPISMR